MLLSHIGLDAAHFKSNHALLRSNSYNHILFDEKVSYIVDQNSYLFELLKDQVFDSTCNVYCADLDIATINSSPILSLLPEIFPKSCVKELMDDIINLTTEFYQFSYNSGDASRYLVCRLQLINLSANCNWHEDHVSSRLLKSYLGEGTQWCNPLNLSIRKNNEISRLCGLLYEIPEADVQRSSAGDILIIAGKYNPDCLPVLHRAPPPVAGAKSNKRLLYSVTVPRLFD